MAWEKLFALLGGILIAWFLFRTIKGHPERFNREALGKSFNAMGLLGLLLIAFVAFLIFLVRQT